MKQVKETMTGVYIGIGIYALIVESVGLLCSDDRLKYTVGLLFGVSIAIVLIHHMAKTLDYALDLSENDAAKYVKKQSFLRLFIMLLALIVGFRLEICNFLTVILGMLGLKIAALFAPLILKILYPESYITKEEEYVE